MQVKRAYEKAVPGDGARILVDRIWPRGLSKESLKIQTWAKDVAPSTELRRWFGHDPAKWLEFQERYFRELDASPETWKPIAEAAHEGTTTLIYGARDTTHNNAVALATYLDATSAHHAARTRKAKAKKS